MTKRLPCQISIFSFLFLNENSNIGNNKGNGPKSALPLPQIPSNGIAKGNCEIGDLKKIVVRKIHLYKIIF